MSKGAYQSLANLKREMTAL